MTWKRVIIFVAALIWIVICAVSVFATELAPQAENRENIASSLNIARFDMERLSANAFGEIYLIADNTETLAIALFDDDSTRKTSCSRTYTTANADFMQEVQTATVNTTVNSSINPTTNTASTLMSETNVPKRPRSPQGVSSPSFASAKRQSSKSTPK